MANATYQQTNFTAGHISPLLFGRTDIAKFYNGVSTLENFISTKHGPVCRRAGTRFVAETKSSQAGSVTSVHLIPFQFSTDQTYQLEFGDGYIRIFLNRGRLLDDGTVKLVGADADSPFELGSPYRALVSNPTMSNGAFTAGGGKQVATAGAGYTYDSTRGIVTVNFDVPHTMDVGNIIKVFDTSTPAGEVEGIFSVLDDVDSDTLTYAKATGGTTGTISVDVPDLVTITTTGAHGLSVGQYVTISGATPSEYNGTYLIETIPSSTTFTYKRENNGSDPGDTSTEGTIAMVDSGVDKIGHKQSADVLFLTHPNVKPKELQRKNGFQVLSGTYAGTPARANLVISTSVSPHGFQANDPTNGIFSKVIVSGCTPSEYNGCYTIDSVTENSISYTPGSAPGGPITVVGNVDGWQLVDFENSDGPYLDKNVNSSHTLATTATTIDPDQLAASTDTFSQLDEGRLFRILDSGSDLTWGRISWVDSATSLLYEAPDLNSGRRPDNSGNQTVWHLGSWSTGVGWPRTIGFIQGRSAFGGNASQPQTIWISESNNIVGFQPEDWDTTTVTDDMGIVATIDDDQVNTIHWMTSLPQGLLIGTESAEFLLEGRAKFDPITPTNTVISAQSFIGSKAFIQPVRAGNTAILFVQRAGRKIYQMIFDIDSDALRPRDITQLAEDLTRSSDPNNVVEDLAYQQEPQPIIWAHLTDGTLLGCTYEIDEDVISWHKHIIGGTDAKVKSISVISDTSGDSPTDQLWMVVSRTINGATVEYIEYIEDSHETGDDLDDAFYVDSGFTYDDTATTSITGLEHLEGETVKVFGDGVAQADQVVSSGAITITSASTVQVGLSYTSKLATLPIEVRQAQPESNQKIKRLERAHVRFLNSQGVQFGVTETDLENVEFSDTTSLHSTVIEDMEPRSSYDRDQKLWLVNSGVFPTTIQSITIEAEVQQIQG